MHSDVFSAMETLPVTIQTFFVERILRVVLSVEKQSIQRRIPSNRSRRRMQAFVSGSVMLSCLKKKKKFNGYCRNVIMWGRCTCRVSKKTFKSQGKALVLYYLAIWNGNFQFTRAANSQGLVWWELFVTCYYLTTTTHICNEMFKTHGRSLQCSDLLTIGMFPDTVFRNLK